MKRYLAVLIAALALVAPASAVTNHPPIDKVASTFAMRPVTVQCQTWQEWKNDFFSAGVWGYVFGYNAESTFLHPLLCENLLAITRGVNPPVIQPKKGVDLDNPNKAWSEIGVWQMAVSVLTLVHESYHLRNWDMWHNEAVVECRAIRHWKVGARLLGASEPLIAKMEPWVYAFHWRLAAKAPQYFLKSCKSPWLYP